MELSFPYSDLAIGRISPVCRENKRSFVEENTVRILKQVIRIVKHIKLACRFYFHIIESHGISLVVNLFHPNPTACIRVEEKRLTTTFPSTSEYSL